MAFTDRLKHAWDAFRNRDPTHVNTYGLGESNHINPGKVRLRMGNERSIIASIYNRMAIDCASIEFRHVRVDQNGRYIEDINDSLNKCLTVSPNLDQTPRAFIQDIVLSMFDEGYVAMFPAESDNEINEETMTFDIYQLRRARILEWYPEHVRVEAYNQKTGRLEEIILSKKNTAIIENPLYMVMNGQNSTLKRLISKLNMLDAIDQQSSSGKMDLIIQLPYTIKTEARKAQAEKRRKEIEVQLTGSKYGIAYMDATERITQLNRPIENNLLAQVDYLTKELYAQLGTTPGVMDGTASEQEMTNYQNRTVEPIVTAIADEMKRKFLTKTARSQGQTIMFFNDPFKLIPSSQMSEMADKLIRNTILSPNEFRAILGYKPSEQDQANELRNPNIAKSKEELEASGQIPTTDDGAPGESSGNSVSDETKKIIE